jgi:hypothetical protein
VPPIPDRTLPRLELVQLSRRRDPSVAVLSWMTLAGIGVSVDSPLVRAPAVTGVVSSGSAWNWR